MEHRIFRFAFDAGVHIGDSSLEDSGIRLRADTIFSALCIEALKKGGQETLDRLITLTIAGELSISDAFPFIGNELYVPKPVFSIQSADMPQNADILGQSPNGEADEVSDYSAKKIFKELKYIPIDMVQDFLYGEFDGKTAEYIASKMDGLGASSIVARTAVRLPEDALPYHVGVYTFKEGAGLYIIASAEAEALPFLRELLECVAVSGIGGKRSSGLGRFSITETAEDIPEELLGDYPAYMTLSVSLPGDAEIESALKDSTYVLLRRSGFVFSETYAHDAVRKNDLYVMDSGSVFRQRFTGGVYDVSNKGTHPVYRYAKPMFLGVEL